MELNYSYNRKETNMQATDTELRIEIERLQVLLKDTKMISDSNFQLYLKLQDNVRSFFEGSVGNQYKQIGNAVPVKLAEAMGKQIKQFLAQS